MISVQQLTKGFDDLRRGWVAALDHVSFDVQPGEIFGLLGPNGAGKTTCLRILSTVLRPSSGTATVSGFDVVKHPAEVRQRIGMLFQRPNPFPTLSIKGNVAVGAKLIGHRGSELDDLIEWALRKAGLWEEVREKLNTPAIELSGRAAAAVVHRALHRGAARGAADG